MMRNISLRHTNDSQLNLEPSPSSYFGGVQAKATEKDENPFFEGIPPSLPLRMKVKIKLHSSLPGIMWDLFQTFISLVSCIFYVITTYNAPSKFFQVSEIVLTALFLIDFLLRFYCSDNRIRYWIEFNSIIDIGTIVPVMLEIYFREVEGQATSASSLSFLRFVRILRVMRILRAFKVLNRSFSAIKRQLFTLFLTIASIMFLSAGLIQMVEQNGSEDIDFATSLYFIIVTISTVGYGDISPQTPLGKVIVAGMIVVSLILVPIQINKLTDLLQMQSKYRTRYYSSEFERHVIVTGYLENISLLRNFLIEFFHPDRLAECDDITLRNIKVIILSPDEPSEELRSLMVSAYMEGRVQYIKGSVMKEDDLQRVDAKNADGCFILTKKHSNTSDLDDAENVLRVLVMENHASQIISHVQVIHPKNKNLLQMAGADQIVCIDELKYAMLGLSIVCPGSTTLIGNLVRSMSIRQSELEETTLQDYFKGCEMEIYCVPIPLTFDQWMFQDFVLAVYEGSCGQVIVMAVEVRTIHEERSTYEVKELNIAPPIDYILNFESDETELYAYVLADDNEVAHVVSQIISVDEGIPTDVIIKGEDYDRSSEFGIALKEIKPIVHHDHDEGVSSRRRSFDRSSINMKLEQTSIPKTTFTLDDIYENPMYEEREDDSEYNDSEYDDKEELDMMDREGKVIQSEHPIGTLNKQNNVMKKMSTSLRIQDKKEYLSSQKPPLLRIKSTSHRIRQEKRESPSPNHQYMHLRKSLANEKKSKFIRSMDDLFLFDVKKETSITNHIIIICKTTDLASIPYFLEPLKVQCKESNLPHIVLLLKEDPREDVTLKSHLTPLRKEPNIFIVIGKSSDCKTLVRSGIEFAYSVVLLSSEGATHSIDGEVLDFEMIYSFIAMERFFGSRFLQLSNKGKGIVNMLQHLTGHSSSSSSSFYSIENGEESDENNAFISSFQGMDSLKTPRGNNITNIDSDEPLHIVVELASLATMTVVNRTIMKTLETYVEKKKKEEEEEEEGKKRHSRNLSRLSILETPSRSTDIGPSSEESSFMERTKQRFMDFLGYKRSEAEEQPENQTIKIDESSIHLPVHAAGFVFSSDIFDFLLCQSFFSPEIVRFVEKLLHVSTLNYEENHEEEENETKDEDHDTNDEKNKKKRRKRRSTLSSNKQGDPLSSLISIPIPPDFVNKKFIHFFTHLTRKFNAVCIALYRRNKESLPYVYTGPDSMTVLRETDYAMILTCYQPEVFMTMTFEEGMDIKADSVKNRLARPRVVKEGIHLNGIDAFKFKINA